MTNANSISAPSWPLALAAAAIVATCVLGAVYCYAPFIDLKWGLSPWGDTVFLTGSLFCEASRSLMSGKLPLLNWATYEAIDYNTHIAAYYPLFGLRFLHFCSAQQAVQGQDIIAVIHVAIYFLTTLTLTRICGAGWAGSAVGALLGVVALNTLALAKFATIIAPAAWLPLAVAGLVQILYHEKLGPGVFLLALGTAAMLTAGPGTNMLAALVFIGLIFAIHALRPAVIARDWAQLLRFSKVGFLAGAIVAVAVAASTINLYLHMSEIVRWTRTGAVIGGAGPARATEILAEKQSLWDLPQLVAATGAHYALGSFFVGPLAILLAIAGGWLNRTSRIGQGFAWIAVSVVALVFVIPGFLLLVWEFIPGLGHVRHLSILATPFALAVAVLAGLGVTKLTASFSLNRDDQLVFRTAIVAVALLTVAGVFASPIDLYLTAATRALAFVPLAIALVAIFGRSAMIRALGIWAAIMVHIPAMDVFITKSPGQPEVTKSQTWHDIDAALDFVSQDSYPKGRVAFHPSISQDGMTNQRAGEIASYRRIPTFNYYMSPRIYWRFKSESALFQKPENYGPINGSHIVAQKDLSAEMGPEVFRSGDIRVYRLKSYRPLISAVCPQLESKVLSVNRDRSDGRLPLVDPGVVAALQLARYGSADCPNQITDAVRDPDSDTVRWSVTPGAGTLLIINLPPYSAWKLVINGTPVPAYSLNDSQIVVAVPDTLSGTAVLTYSPSLYFALLRVSAAGWLILLAFGAFVLIGKERRTAQSAHA